MRPIELILESIGPYRGRVAIDFRVLGDFFLVWGRTGSGKTTLFDAMTYALYGEAPGSRKRLAVELRSQFAQAGEEPRVELTFALGPRQWRVTRTPPWTRLGRGGKQVTVKQEAALDSSREGGWERVAEGPRDVDARIEALLGLSVDDFSRIILLPQGEFQRFLEMDSTERVKILEKLFPVDLHDRVTELAVQKAKDALAALRSLTEGLARLEAEGANTEGAAKLARLGEGMAGLSEALEAALRRRVEADSALKAAHAERERRRNHEAALARLERAEAAAAGLPAMTARRGAARSAARVLPALEEGQAAAERAERGRSELAERQRLFDSCSLRGPEVEADRAAALTLAAERAAIDRQRGELGSAIAAWAGLAALGARLEADRSEAAITDSARARALAVEAEARASVEAALLPEDAFDRAQSEFDGANTAFNAAKERLRAIESLEELRRGEEAAGQAAVRATTALAEASLALAGFEAARKGGLAAELAAALAFGEPCPVCGSTEHPAPAGAPRGGRGAGAAAGGAAALAGPETGAAAALKLRHEAATGARAAAEADCIHAQSSRERAEEAVRALMVTAPHAAAPPAPSPLAAGQNITIVPIPSAGDARLLRDAAQKAAGEAGEALQAVRKGQKELEEKRRVLEAAGAELRRSESARSATQASLAGLSAQYAAAEASAGAEDPRPLAAALDRARVETEARSAALLAGIGAFEKDLTVARARLAEASERQPGLDAAARTAEATANALLEACGFAEAGAARSAAMATEAISTLEGEIRRLEIERGAAGAAAEESARAVGKEAPADVPALEEALSEAASGFSQAQGALLSAKSEAQKLSSLFDRLEAIQAEVAELTASSGRYAGLAELLAGKIAPRRLPFKTFVLAAYFRVVVDRASLRLGELSEGRFALIADEGAGGGLGRIGLEILVRDSWNGKTRPSGTLSGGERFLTSLSLALGLADTIRSRSGGVSLDSVFIDEGFGSLDDETLDRAIGALDRARGQRLIGIVSHVAELRNRIPARIEVKKGHSGSTLSLHGLE
ncbi:MAG: AAA family ATPase [Rectinemataceae bacterium]